MERDDVGGADLGNDQRAVQRVGQCRQQRLDRGPERHDRIGELRPSLSFVHKPTGDGHGNIIETFWGSKRC